MIKFTYRILRDANFLVLMQRIYASRMAVRSAHRLLKIMEEIQVELELSNKAFDELAEKHLVQRADGNSYDPKTPDEQKFIDKFFATPVTINQPPITAQELFHVELSPNEVKLLEGIIHVD